MVKRPYEFKLDSYRLYREGKTPIEAFKIAGEIHNVPLSKCMTTKAWASSYMSDDIKNRIRKMIKAGDPLTLKYFKKHKLRNPK